MNRLSAPSRAPGRCGRLALLALATGWATLVAAETVVFSEDFGVVDWGAPASASCAPDFPAGWVRHNVDGHTPDSQLGWVDEAWVVSGVWTGAEGNCVAYSTSYYSPPDASDDWLVTPSITVPAVNPKLRFRARVADVAYPDGYEVRWGTGSSVGDLSANPPLLTVNAETDAWSSREIDVSALAGQTVHFAFRNISNDKFLLMLDDVQVVSVPNHDAQITSVLRPHADLLQVPAAQVLPLQLGATVRNGGAQPVTNVVVTASVKLDGGEIHSVAAAALPSLAAGASADVSLPAHVANVPGVVTVDYSVTIAEADPVPANDAMSSASLTVTAQELGADDGVRASTLGIGAANGGQIGVRYQLAQPAWVTAIRYFAVGDNPQLGGASIVGEIRSMAGSPSRPDALIAQTTPYVVPDPPVAGFVDLPLASPVLLAAGDYYFGVVEPSHDPGLARTLDLGLAMALYQPGRNWVRAAPSIPDWTAIESVNPPFFERALMLRVMFTSSVADLSAIKAMPAVVAAGSAFSYTLEVANAGPDAADALRASIVLPGGATFVSAAGSGWLCEHSAGTLTCTRPTLAIGSAPPITVNLVAPDAAVVLSSDATVISSAGDPGGPTVASASTAVISPASVQATKTVAGDRRAGGAITYTVVLSNTGTSAQQDNPGHEFTDVLPAGLNLTSAAATAGSVIATPGTSTVSWDGAIAAGGSVTLNIEATIAAGAAVGTLIANQAGIAFDANGDGVNESAGLSDDPTRPGAADATAFNVLSDGVSTFTHGALQASFSGGGPTCTFAHAQVLPVAAVPAPSSAKLLADLFDFRLEHCDTTPVTLTLTYPHVLPAGTRYWKYDPATQVWTLFADAQILGATVVLTLQDGGAGDDDGVVNGQIVDPGAPGLAAASAIPGLSAAAALMLAALMGGVGALARRRAGVR